MVTANKAGCGAGNRLPGLADRAGPATTPQQRRPTRGWRYLVHLTDLARALDRTPVIAEVDVVHRTTMVSLPALGALGSNFDAADAVRVATYSKRGHEQREKLSEYDESQPYGQDDRGDTDATGDRDAATADADAGPSSPESSGIDPSAAPNPSADRENSR